MSDTNTGKDKKDSAYDSEGLGKFSGDETIVVGAQQGGKQLARHVTLSEADDKKASDKKKRRQKKTPGGLALPTLFVLGASGTTRYPIRPNVFILTVGSSREESTITLRDPNISGKQLAILKIGGEWVFLDCGIKDVVKFNGIQQRQHVAPVNCRVVIQVGSQFLLFISEFDATLETATVRLKKKLLLSNMFEDQNLTEGKLIVKCGDQEFTSVKRPILIGQETGCDIRLFGQEIAPYHAFIFWHLDGVFIQPLTHREVIVNGAAITEATRLEKKAKIEILENTLNVSFVGDCPQRCRELFPEDIGLHENFSLTALANSEANSVDLQHFTLGYPIMVGRSGENEVVLNDTAVSRQHCQLIPSNKSFMLIDNYSANGTYVNGERITKMRVRAGDIVEIGNSYFLVHYS